MSQSCASVISERTSWRRRAARGAARVRDRAVELGRTARKLGDEDAEEEDDDAGASSSSDEGPAALPLPGLLSERFSEVNVALFSVFRLPVLLSPVGAGRDRRRVLLRLLPLFELLALLLLLLFRLPLLALLMLAALLLLTLDESSLSLSLLWLCPHLQLLLLVLLHTLHSKVEAIARSSNGLALL